MSFQGKEKSKLWANGASVLDRQPWRSFIPVVLFDGRQAVCFKLSRSKQQGGLEVAQTRAFDVSLEADAQSLFAL